MRIHPTDVLRAIVARAEGSGLHLDSILRAFLTGITAEDGLSVSRAMVFLADEECTFLCGRLAVGPLTRIEAEGNWASLAQIAKESDRQSYLALLVDRALEFSGDVRIGKTRDTELSARVQQLILPVTSEAGAVALTFLRTCSTEVGPNCEDPARVWLRTLADPDETVRGFLCVPIAYRDVSLGVLIVDHAYLHDWTRLDDEVKNSIETFGLAIGAAIERDRLNRRLLDGERVREWRSFVTKIGHVIGTHVNIFRKSVDDLGELTIENPELMRTPALLEIHDELRGRLERMQQVLDDFRRFGEPSSLKLERIDLRTAVACAIRDGSLLGCSAIEYTPPEHPIFVYGDERRLTEAITQLIENAHQAMQNQDTPRPSIQIQLKVEEDGQPVANLRVTDTGPGIADGLGSRIFEPGFTTKASGTGLGLTIVKDIIVDQHHGEVLAESGERGGRFIVRLPLANPVQGS